MRAAMSDRSMTAAALTAAAVFFAAGLVFMTYWPHLVAVWQSGAFSKHLIVRTSSDPRRLAAMVRRELHSVDPTAAVEHVKTMEDIRRESVAPRTFAMRLLVGFALVASALALVGIYGVLSLSVGARTKEIAVPLDKILSTKSPDVALLANDILFVPTSAAKNAAIRGLEAALQIGTGLAIYRR